jgi:hypothetical protein
VYSALAAAILVLHLLFILWIVFGVTVTRRRPVLRWLHLGCLAWGILIELLPWTCPLTWAENWLRLGPALPHTRGDSCCTISTLWFIRTFRLVCSPAWVSPSVSSI